MARKGRCPMKLLKINKQMDQWLDALTQDATPGIDECVEYLGTHIEWLKELRNTRQDPEWHAEGNVHIHTGMVLKELYCLMDNELSHISGTDRQALILAALLHDIGKPYRTKDVEINGVVRVACPQHEAVGRSYLAFKLMDLKLSFDVVWTVLGLVGEHHMPKRLVVKNQNRNEYLALSRRANLEFLYWLEVADMKGRVCPDQSLQLQHLDEFKMFAQEYGVWSREHRLDSNFLQLVESESKTAKEYICSTALYEMEAELISLPVEAIARTFEYKNSHSNLLVLCGPSGSGKSTWIERYSEGSTVISLDSIREELAGDRASQKNNGRVVHLAKDRLKECLRRKQDVIWDATNLRSDFRKIICDFGRDYKALVTLVLFLPSESAIFLRNRKRNHPVPNDVLLKQLDGFQFPLVGEAHRMKVIDENGNCHFSTGY